MTVNKSVKVAGGGEKERYQLKKVMVWWKGWPWRSEVTRRQGRTQHRPGGAAAPPWISSFSGNLSIPIDFAALPSPGIFFAPPLEIFLLPSECLICNSS